MTPQAEMYRDGKRLGSVALANDVILLEDNKVIALEPFDALRFHLAKLLFAPNKIIFTPDEQGQVLVDSKEGLIPLGPEGTTLAFKRLTLQGVFSRFDVS